MLLAVDLGETVSQAIGNGVDILSGGKLDMSRMDIAGFTLIAQILATIVLFLIVRFKFWDKVTAILEKRKMAVTESLEKKKNAEIEAQKIQEEANNTISIAKQEAKNIIQEAKDMSNIEADNIKQSAFEEIEREKIKAQAEIERNVEEIQSNMKKEIVDVAYLLADKIVKEQMDENKNKEIINDFLNGEGTIHG